jgi:DNA excision repair protein ERCC-6
LGKTAQMCVHLGSLGKLNRFLGNMKQAMFLIICPATVLQHWLIECQLWAPNMRTGIFHHISKTGKEMSSLKSKGNYYI